MTITANQAIRNAVEAEKAAAQFYRFLAENTDDADSRKFLVEMAVAEDGHANAIETEGIMLLRGPLAARADSDVDMVEALPEWKFAENVSLADALRVAHKAELQAAMYYDAFADFFEGAQKKFFQDLAKTEEDHARSLEARMKK
jgi:rubrerythrin